MDKKERIMTVLEFVVSAIIGIITYALSENINGYNLMCIIPIIYSCVSLTTQSFHKDKSFMMKSLHIIMFIKYVLMPIIIVINRDYYNGILTGNIPKADSVQKAIWFIIYEMLTIFFIVSIKDVFVKNIHIQKGRQKKTTIEISFIVFMIIGLILCGKFGSVLIPKSFFVLDETYEVGKIQSNMDGLIKILFNLFKVMIFLYLLQKCFSKYQKEPKNIYIIFSAIVVLCYIALQTSISRWNILIPIIIYLYMAHIFFKDKFIFIALSVITVLVISIISISIYKFSWLFNSEGSSIRKVFYILTQQVQEYFSGPRAVAQGFEAVDNYRNRISFKTLFNDYLGSIPYISHFINQEDRINVYYNYYLKGENATATQIMPIINIGKAYFGTIGAPILMLIYLIISIRIGQKERNTKNIFYKYIDCFAILVLNMSIYFNTQIVFGFMLDYIIPWTIAIKLNEYIILKKERKYERRTD